MLPANANGWQDSLRQVESQFKVNFFCTYDTSIGDDLTIDMISCQEQLEIEFQDWCINIRFENYGIYGIMLGMKGSKHIMLDKDLRMMTSQVQRLA